MLFVEELRVTEDGLDDGKLPPDGALLNPPLPPLDLDGASLFGVDGGRVEGLVLGRVDGRVEGLVLGFVLGRVRGLVAGRVEGRLLSFISG